MKINTRLLVRIALLCAISIILGKFLSFKIEPWGRISLENLTVIMAGYLYGSVIGIICGVTADLVGCLCYGYAINPIITLGAAMVGAYSGIFGMNGLFKKGRLYLSIAFAHLCGSVIVKSFGLHLYYATPLETLSFRIPIYIFTGLIEFALLKILLNSRGLSLLREN